MKIAIVDDSQEMLEMIQSCVEVSLGRNLCESDIFKNPEALLICMEYRKRYDVYLLDIEMPQINGLELAKKIREMQENAYIIFITSHEKFALDSYDIGIKAYNYILKDKIGEQLPIVLAEVQRELRRNEKEFYVIENHVKIEKIRIDDITHIYKDGKNSIFKTEESTYNERKSLENILHTIDKPEFICVFAL